MVEINNKKNKIMTQLLKKIEIEAKIELLTGLHIGGTNSAMGIGGPDSTVVRNPINNQPYIPGSSLKGKMRSLIEISDGTITKKDKGHVRNLPAQSAEVNSVKLFGNSSGDEKQHPSRLIVRDARLIEDEDLFKNTDLPYTESKTEVTIDRITAKAMPRQLERVPAGAMFDLKMIINVFDTDDEDNLKNTLIRALKLLKDDYLGGNGSRGYGQIDIKDIKAIEKKLDFYINNNEPAEITSQFNLE